MELYTVFTINEVDDKILFDTFDSPVKAKNFIDSNTESNIKLVGGDAVLYEKFGTSINSIMRWKPVFVNKLFPFHDVEYGTVVRETITYGYNKGVFNYIYRFMIQQELKK